MTETEEAEPVPEEAEPARERPRRSGWRMLGRAGLALIGAPFVFALIAALILIGREVTAPSWVTDAVETRAGALLDGGALSFDDIHLTLGGDLHPRVRLSGAVLSDRDGTVLLKVPEAEGLISPRGLLQGEVLAQEITLTGAQITLRRETDGALAVALGGAAEIEGAPDFPTLLERIEGLLARPELAALEDIRAEGLIVNYTDGRARRSWTVDGGRLAIDLRGGRTQMRADLALLSGRAFVTTLAMSYTSERGSAAAELGLTLRDAAAADLATQSAALSWLAVLDAPLSANMRARTDRDGALTEVSAALQIGEGALRPTETARPLGFEAAQAYLGFDPESGTLRFDEITVESDWGSLTGQGQAFLRDMVDGWPGALVGQFAFDRITTNPGALYAEPIEIGHAVVDLRLVPDPFALDIGQLRLTSSGSTLDARGSVAAGPDGWAVALDAEIDEIAVEKVMALWPESLRPNTRVWFARNLLGGTLFRVTGALRSEPGTDPARAIGFEYRDANVRFLRTMPPIEAGQGHAAWDGTEFTLVLEEGHVDAPSGGRMDLGGSVFHIPDIRIRNAPATVALAIDSSVQAALAILDAPPFEFLTKAGLPVALAQGQARITGAINLPLKPRIPREEIGFGLAARLSEVESDVIVRGRRLTGTDVQVIADTTGISVSGPMQVGTVPIDATWRQSFVPGEGDRSEVRGVAELSPAFLDEFGIGLPPGTLRGSGFANLEIDLAREETPVIRLNSDLQGVALSIPALGWSLSTGGSGTLEVAGTLGETPRIDRLSLEAPGLRANGQVTLNAGGGLAEARFERVRAGTWLDAPVTLAGRGAGQPPRVTFEGGRLDLRGLPETGAGGGGPLRLVLNRLQITREIALTDFVGEFTPGDGGGLNGTFIAWVNGRGAVEGTLVPRDGRSAMRLVSNDAGAVVSAAGFMPNALGGQMDLTLIPAGGPGSFDGALQIANIRVRDAPALASLLSAISVVGLLQQFDGQGLAFDDVEARFRLTPDRVIVTQSSAVGASLGISLDGIYSLADRSMDFQGVVSPFYLINAIGSVLTRPGEGLIGFNFTLTGPPGQTRVAVNPLSALTPGMFREIFRRPPPQVGQGAGQ